MKYPKIIYLYLRELGSGETDLVVSKDKFDFVGDALEFANRTILIGEYELKQEQSLRLTVTVEPEREES